MGFTSEGSALLLDVLCEGGGEDLDHGLGGELVHGVVLVVAAGEVAEHVPGQLVDPLDDLGHVVLEVLDSQQSLELLKFNNLVNVSILLNYLNANNSPQASHQGSYAPTRACRDPH